MPLPKPYREERTEEPMVDKELIENWRNMLKPSISSWLLKTNYEGVGEQDKEEFERDFDEILDLAFIGLKHRAQLLQERTEERTESLCKKVRALCEESKIEFFFVGGGESTWSVTNDKHIKKIVECHKAQLSQEGTTKDATSDTISRQAAIDAIDRLDIPEDMCVFEILSHIELEIGNLPSAQPERKKGKWIYGEDEYGIDGYHCDKCGFFVPWDYTHTFINYIEDYNFCPKCGSYNGGEQDG